MASLPQPSATGVIFSSSRPTDAPSVKDDYKESPSSSAKASPAASIHDAEKAESTFEDEEKALASYVVPALEKGVKGARLSQSRWIRFRVWYNPYRMVSSRPDSRSFNHMLTMSLQNFTLAFTLNMVGILVACLHKFPYAEKHGPALALGNFVASVACRNEFFLRNLFWVVVKIFQKVGIS